MNQSNYMSLFPTMDTVLEAIRFIESQCPIQNPNDMFPLLMMYHNTLLKAFKEDQVVQIPTVKDECTDTSISKFDMFEEYKVVSLLDIDDLPAGSQLSVMRTNKNVLYLLNGHRAVFVGAVEGTHFKLIQKIPEQQVLPL